MLFAAVSLLALSGHALTRLGRRRPALAIECASVELERFVAWSAPVKIIA
jgi:hypothetical protein